MVASSRGANGLFEVVAQLQGLIFRRSWERDILPLRVEGYQRNGWTN